MELVKIYNTGRTIDLQQYTDKDNQLIVSSYTNSEIDPNQDIIEITVYGESGEYLDYNPTISTYKVSQGNVNPVTGLYNKIELDPKKDVNSLGLTRGRINAQYSFLKPLFNSSNLNKYWIKEISPSGTELKLSSQNLSNELIRSGFSSFQSYVSTKNYYVDFYLNFAQNRLVIANNALLAEESGEVYLLVKLYEPLPDDFQTKDTLWLCDKVADSIIYTIDTQITEEAVISQNALRGPNNRIKVREKIGQTTPYYSYTSLFSSAVSSSTQQLLSYYEDKSVEINVDYTDFSNFVHFSSATERLNNFVYKLGLIEQYKSEIQETQDFTSMSPTTLNLVSQSNTLAQQNIDNIINKFDTYEYYLYFSSESFAWPKSTSTKPYQLYSITSSEALNWLGGEYVLPTANTASLLYSASLYDNRNADRLSTSIPQYLLDDPNNEPYLTFIDMVGQHFDNVWLYYKDLSNRYSSFNSPNLGLSKDMVADALRGFGFNLYTNTSLSDNLYYTLFGVNQDGSLLPPTGSEKYITYVTSSIDTLSPTQLNTEIYKRLYHNLTYLLKTKGTQRGVKALVACYGIPESILDVNEFGGNSRYTGSGIYEINDQKINYFTSSAELSTPLLSPYVTIQKYNTDYRLNTNDIETGFSPSDEINRNFVSSSGFVSMDQLIGNPNHQYLQYYPDLKTARDNYFASYVYPHSVWEYIRIIKYYNNSLFKTIKDFVPSRANSSTGIIVKSHILERNKYARTEPSMSFDNNISESIDMVSITGSDPGAVQGSTQYTENIITPLGYTSFDYTENKAKITGRLSGSFVQVTTGEAFDQSDYSTTPSGSIEVDYAANYQNIFTNTRSKRFFELDFGYNQNTPTNYGLVTQSISNSIDNNFNTYNDPYAPYADIQDYNYYTRAFTDFRYYGSSVSSQLYNTYTAGDSSYGKTAAIDKIKRKYAYLVDIYTASAFFPNRSNAQIKYLIDDIANVTNLTKANFNIFDVQNIFKSGETCDVSLFQYDELNPYAQLLAINKTIPVYEGGFRYLPILHNISGSASSQSFELVNPISFTTALGGPSDGAASDPRNFFVSIDILESGTNPKIRRYRARVSNEVTNVSVDTYVQFSYTLQYTVNNSCTSTNTTYTFPGAAPGAALATIPSGSSFSQPIPIAMETYDPDCVTITNESLEGSIISVSGGSTSSTGSVTTYLTTAVTSSQPCLFFNTSSNQLVLSGELSYYAHQGYQPLFNSISDPSWSSSLSLPRVVIPFSLDVGDKISFYNSSSLGWDERWEYTIRQVSTTGSFSNLTGSRYLIDTDRVIDGSLISQSATPDAVTKANYKTCRYIFWKHVPDETNVILKYNPKDSTIVEEGILLPQYIDTAVKSNAGNVVKSLKSDNLI